MSDSAFDVSAIVRSKAAVDGDGGAAWVTALPGVIAGLEQAWSFRLISVLGAGTSSFTARVRIADGAPAVLKVAVPDATFARQVRTLVAARGRGYAQVLAFDLERDAVLLEELGPSLDRCGLAPEQQLRALSDTLRHAWALPRPDGPDGEPVDKALLLGAMVTELWEALGRPCSARVRAAALACARRRSAAFAPDRCVVTHGDAAPPNLLRVLRPRPGAQDGFAFVDPDGVVGDPEHDLGVALRDWSPQLLAGDAVAVADRYCRVLAARSGRDAAAIWEWGLLERVSTGLYALSLGAEALARPLLTTAEALTAPGARAQLDAEWTARGRRR